MRTLSPNQDIINKNQVTNYINNPNRDNHINNHGIYPNNFIIISGQKSNKNLNMQYTNDKDNTHFNTNKNENNRNINVKNSKSTNNKFQIDDSNFRTIDINNEEMLDRGKKLECKFGDISSLDDENTSFDTEKSSNIFDDLNVIN